MTASILSCFGMGKISRPWLTAGLLFGRASAAGIAAALMAESSHVANNK
jgi:hypothetical protein